MGKIIAKEQFKEIRKELKSKGSKVILCHGVFDLIHPGHIIHFEEAKSLGDVLVVSITSAAYVRKGPGRPYFSDELRLMFLSSLEIIDYVILSECYTVDDIIESVEPDLYVKGQEYSDSNNDVTGKISEETALVRAHGGDVYFSSGQVFSSTKLINTALPALSDETKLYMQDFKKRYTFQDIKDIANKISELKVLVVGDVIIDEYVFCTIQGMMSKDMGYSARYMESEQYLGGSLAIARHISSFTEHVAVASIVGNEKNLHSRFLNDLSNKMRVILECSDTFETIIKKRFIQENEKREEFHKIFSINNLPEKMEIDSETMSRFKAKLNDIITNYDIVVLCDFGHGLVDEEVIDIIQKKAKFLALNCQTNSSNYGMNLITKYQRADAFALDQRELKLAFSNYKSSEGESLKKLAMHLGNHGWLTRGSKGATVINEKNELVSCPAFTLKVKDTIGAGDAFYALASLCAAAGAPWEVGTFLGNIMGALASNIVGNKDYVDKVDVLKYASTLMNI